MTAPNVEPASASWEDYLEIFYAPSRVFARRGGRWAVPLVVLVVLTALIVLGTMGLLQPIIEAEGSRAMAKSMANMTQEQRDQAEAMSGQMGWILPAAIIGATAVLPIILGIILWLVGKMFGAVQQLGAAIMVAVFAYFPRLLAGAITGLQAAIIPEEKLTGMSAVSLSPARMFDPVTTQPQLIALLMRFDVFVIWTTVLLAIGLKVTGKISTQQAAIAGFVMWLIGSVPALFGMLRS